MSTIRCCDCFKVTNKPLLERTKTDQIFDEVIGKFKKVTNVIGYLCKTCSRKKYAESRPKGKGWREFLREAWETSQKKSNVEVQNV